MPALLINNSIGGLSGAFPEKESRPNDSQNPADCGSSFVTASLRGSERWGGW